jgi:hypothetical protein
MPERGRHDVSGDRSEENELAISRRFSRGLRGYLSLTTRVTADGRAVGQRT